MKFFYGLVCFTSRNNSRDFGAIFTNSQSLNPQYFDATTYFNKFLINLLAERKLGTTQIVLNASTENALTETSRGKLFLLEKLKAPLRFVLPESLVLAPRSLENKTKHELIQ